MITKQQVIDYLRDLQNEFIDNYIIENNIDKDEIYIECEEAEEIQNTINILEELK